MKLRTVVTNILLLAACCFWWSLARAGEIVIDDFKNGLDSRWNHKSFQGITAYFPCQDEDRPCLRAVSHASASGLFHEISYDPMDMPYLRWSWKVDNIIVKGDERSKQGDDYAARVYVVFPSLLFWRTRALNYIWANKLAKGAMIPSTYTKNAAMIAVESGPENLGKWRSETRNILADFRQAFGEDPPLVGAIAIMTDTDNTGEQASAAYGAITVSSESR